ncbi:DUF3027 domain-containing protein [Actinokineospora sp.]|uniref:DUF3027 domain-containing protein n=1 Tax=Actinokineospora sp. TaxID=1872133 RepID=UPI003D6AE882
MPAQEAVTDPALLAAVDFARAAAQEQAGAEVGTHVAAEPEDSHAVTHLFEADKPGYRGWRWAVTISSAGPDTKVTVSEVVLLPGPDALTAPPWVPWQERVQAGDLGVGDLLPTAPDDPRLAPSYLGSDDPHVEETALEIGLGRPRVMSRLGRIEAAERWQASDFGPEADMARSAPAHCGTCAFYLQITGALGAAFGVCGNEMAPADGRVVHAEYGCGAHSEAEVEQISPVLVADLIYDDATLDYEPAERAAKPAAEIAPAEAAEGDESEPTAASTTGSDQQFRHTDNEENAAAEPQQTPPPTLGGQPLDSLPADGAAQGVVAEPVDEAGRLWTSGGEAAGSDSGAGEADAEPVDGAPESVTADQVDDDLAVEVAAAEPVVEEPASEAQAPAEMAEAVVPDVDEPVAGEQLATDSVVPDVDGSGDESDPVG